MSVNLTTHPGAQHKCTIALDHIIKIRSDMDAQTNTLFLSLPPIFLPLPPFSEEVPKVVSGFWLGRRTRRKRRSRRRGEKALAASSSSSFEGTRPKQIPLGKNVAAEWKDMERKWEEGGDLLSCSHEILRGEVPSFSRSRLSLSSSPPNSTYSTVELG